MRKKIVALICLLLAMAVLPAIVVGFSGHSPTANEKAETTDSAEKTVDNSDIICKNAAKICSEDFCDEALRAALILVNTNYIIDKNSVDNSNFSSSKELISKLKKVYNSVSELYLSENNEVLSIPYSEISNGKTAQSEDYPYLYSVASPWDCFDENYDEDYICVGVSMRGVNYLCENGYSAEDALLWYLPDFEVKKS